MDFFAVILLLAVYYLRPQEWVAALGTLRPAMFTLAFAIFTMFFREKGFSFKSLFKTAHDWLVFAFFAWALFFTPGSISDTWSRLKVMLVSYIVIVQAVNNWKRLNLLLIWWMAFLVFISLMAVLSEFGIDPLGSAYLTHAVNKGRLSFNLSLFENPNALGHSIVPLLLMLYFYFIWKRPLFIKEIGALLMILPAYCLYLTQSKGAFLSGFISTVVGFTFGRPKIAQAFILILALTVGWTGIQMLPRMEQMKTMRADEGIQVRVQAWQVGYNTMKALSPKGTGVDTFQYVFQRIHGYPKAPHSSYVQIGTELGYGGLLLFVGIIYCCFRSLIKTRCENEDEERVRRVLMVMLTSYTVSSWMIGWGFNLTFYVIAGTIAAFQRLNDEKVEQKSEEFQAAIENELGFQGQYRLPFNGVASSDKLGYSVKEIPQPEFQPSLVPAVSAASAVNTVVPVATGGVIAVEKSPDESEAEQDTREEMRRKIWRRPRIIDLILIWALTYAVIWFWQYVMKKL